MRGDLCSLPELSWARQFPVHAALTHCGYTAHCSVSNFNSLGLVHAFWYYYTCIWKSWAVISLETTTGDQVFGNSLLSCMHRHALVYCLTFPCKEIEIIVVFCPPGLLGMRAWETDTVLFRKYSYWDQLVQKNFWGETIQPWIWDWPGI